AEDGIRDRNVTGVQTCALPILNKAILKLTDDDYNNNGMTQLVAERGPAYNINIKIFNELQRTITGWPGGKPNVDDSNRPERAERSEERRVGKESRRRRGG